jgi:hypothetical protein
LRSLGCRRSCPVDVILDDPVFFALSAPHFDLAIGRPFTPIERYLRLMFEVPLLALVGELARKV